MSPGELPELHQGRLDLPTLRALLDDLEALVRIVRVRTRGPDEDRSFRAGRAAFEAREISGLQITYVHDGAIWIDTLRWEGDAVGLVRIAR